MITDTKITVEDKEILEFLERMLVKHKVVRDLLEKIFAEQDQRGKLGGFESDETHRDHIVKH